MVTHYSFIYITDCDLNVNVVREHMLSDDFDVSICPICGDSPNTPTVTPCGHVFCYQCLLSYIEDWPTLHGQDPLECKVCKEKLKKDGIFSLLAFFECWDSTKAAQYKKDNQIPLQDIMTESISTDSKTITKEDDVTAKDDPEVVVTGSSAGNPGSIDQPIPIQELKQGEQTELEKQVHRAGGLRRTSSKVEVCIKLTQDMLNARPDEKMIIFSRKSPSFHSWEDYIKLLQSSQRC